MRRLQARRLDGFVVTHPPNLCYLFNFTGSAGLACCIEGETTLLVDSRYIEHAQSQAVHCSPLLTQFSPERSLKRILRRHRDKRIGIESKHLSYHSLLQLQRGRSHDSNPALIPTTDLIEELRIIKEPSEIEMIQQAFQIAHRAYGQLKKTLSAGLTELEVAAQLEFELRRAGGEGISFETIVASGTRSSLPHGTATRKPLQEREGVLIDFGVRYGGYTSDLTRVHFLSEAKKPPFYDVVRKAQQRALSVIRPGVPCRDVDDAARSFIQGQGYGEYFGPQYRARLRPRSARRSDHFSQEPQRNPGRDGVYN